jgi:hypothetical protein
MSRKNNVNPDYYKIAGRDRPNEDVIPPPRPGAADPASRRRKKKGDGPPPNLIPGAPPVGKRPESDETD